MPDVVAIGLPCQDFAVHIDSLPTGRDEGARILSQSWQGGGKTATAMAALGQLGCTGSYMGVIGDDAYGRFLTEDFHFYGIDTSHLIADGKTAFSLVLSDDRTRGRNILGTPPTGRPYTEGDVDEAFVRRHSFLHLERAGEASQKAARAMHEGGGLVCFDGDSFREETQAFLPNVDIFLGSEFYYRHLFGDSEAIEENLASVRLLGPKIAGFTFGGRGSAVLWDGGYAFAPGYAVPVYDTVGAGDVYHGAFLVGLLRGMDPGQAALFSNAVSAIKCTAPGGRSGIPTFEETLHFMKTGEILRDSIERKIRRYAEFGGGK